MSNVGRKPKALETRRQDGENVLPVVFSDRGIGQPPEQLNELQVELWNTLLPTVEVVLQQSDQASFMGMVVALSRAIEATEYINKHGIVLSQKVLNTRTGSTVFLDKPNPAIKIEESAWKLFNQFADRMGLSPAARTKLGLLGAQALTAAEQLEKKLGEDPWNIRPEDIVEQEGTEITDEE